MPRFGLPSPVGVVRLAVDITRAVVDVIERAVLDAPEPGPLALPAAPARAGDPSDLGDPGDPVQRFQELLEESTRLEADGRQGLAARLVADLVPDEARLLAALSDGGDFAALVVAERGSRGRPGATFVRTSTVGRAAGIREHDLLPVYLDRLEARGLLVIVASAGTGHTRDHQVLQAEGCVTEALEDLRGRGGRPRVDRCVVRLSALGRQVWDATRPA